MRPRIMATKRRLTVAVISAVMLLCMTVLYVSYSHTGKVMPRRVEGYLWPPAANASPGEESTAGEGKSQVTVLQSQTTPTQEERYSKFDHPASANDLWVLLNNKRLAVRRLAYYDTRNSSHPAIVFNAMYDLRHSHKPTPYVLVKYPNSSTECMELEFKTKSGKLDPGMSEYYVYFLLSTKKAVRDRPTTVSLTLDSKCNTTKLSATISVQGVIPGPEAVTYGVCLHKALFRVNQQQVVIDWVELQKELGADLITIYLQGVIEEMVTVLKPYISTGLVEVIDWNLKMPTFSISYTRDYGQSGTINECIYRNMNRVKYLGLMDIDEYIAPESKFNSVPQMMTHLEEMTKDKPVSAYRFYNTYYFEDPVSVPQVKGVSLCPNMKMPRYFRRTQRATHPEKYSSDKLIVKPTAVNVVQVHFVVDHQKQYETELLVPENIGRSDHYRWPYRMNGLTPHEYSDVMGRYAESVLPRIKSRLC